MCSTSGKVVNPIKNQSWNMEDVDKKLEHFSKIKEDIDPRREAGRIILLYLFIGGLWIAMSDQLIKLIIRDVETMAVISTWKGWFYVAITGIVFYRIIKRSLLLYQNAVDTIFDNYKGLGFTHKELVRAEKELQEKYHELDESIRVSKLNEMRLDLAVAGANDAIWEWDIKENDYRFSENWIRECGYNVGEIEASLEGWLGLVHPEDVDEVRRELETYLEEGTGAYRSIFRLQCKRGNFRTVLSKGVCVRDDQGRPVRMAGSHTDISGQVKLQESLRQEQELSNNIIDETAIMILLLSPDWVILRANEYSLKKTGYTVDEVVGRRAFEFVPFDYKIPLAETYEKLVAGEKAGTLEGEILTKDQRKLSLLWNFSLLHNHDDQIRGILLSGTDITERKAMEETLYERAYYDALTGLPNRALLNDVAQVWLNQSEEPTKNMAMVYLDVDNFKHINDIHGHYAGDQMLKYLGKQLESVVGMQGVTARLGGDEYVIALKGADAQSTQEVLNRLVSKLKIPFKYEDHAFYIQISCGVALYPKDGGDLETLFKRADLAAFDAKETGKNRVVFFHPSMEEKSRQFVRMENMLRQAIEKHEFELHYQPQVNMENGKIMKLEALIRWNQPDLGYISPKEFIPLAEQTGHMEQITTWVVREAGRQRTAWKQSGLSVPTISINLSSVHLSQGFITEALLVELKEGWEEKGCLEVEITETAILNNEEMALEQLKLLKKKGITIALDDFGTGYSSLTHLQKLPIDALKVDRSFLLHVLDDPKEQSLYKGVVELAKGLGLDVVAEGVETKEQIAFLLSNKCFMGQGFYFSKVLSAEAMEPLLREGYVTLMDKKEA
jgi:diguanylate cyclase (GGDEF)-like protein/PAS domain S-box-containing protein